jgi:hypothetical protein
MEQIELEVQSSLEQMFKESITVKNTNIVGHCLRTYVAINKPKKAEQIVRSVLVQSAVKKVRYQTFCS